MITRLVIAAAAIAILGGAAAVPDDAQSPGLSATTNPKVICGTVGGRTYTKQHRSGTVERSLHCPEGWQADHRCPLNAGCADAVENLWCQPPDKLADGHLGWEAKDKVDDWAWQQICRHGADPTAIQKRFLAPADWRKLFCEVETQDPRCKR